MSNTNITPFYSRGHEQIELVKVTTNEKGQKLVNAKELYEVLKIQKDFSNWIKNQLESVGAIKDIDFTPLKGKTSEQGGRPGINYVLTLDIAKEICMCVGVAPRTNEETRQLSKQVRKYFIECEKALHNPYANLSPELQSIIMLDQKQQILEQQVQTVQQKVNEIEENAKLDPAEYSLVSKRVSSRVYEVQKERQMNLNKKQIGELFRALNKDILEITGVKTRTQLRQKHLDMVLDFINDWYPSRAAMFNINQMSLEI
ncbi:antA/AntB antirepressor family protein [Turicibacter sanguinis]|uniref:antA/AntB antirepressor family protein n=1 Tax=Turicibacter sanguinis TaxID=154288 RepID=UPI0021D4BA11|nr:antA/AntB antirepressor family protein [Turicibacter sanguinis]MCU7195871.1 antA/AntB antirepressor family protein [Turicibacter sanguinis]